MPIRAPAVFGLLVLLLGVVRLAAARSRRRTSLPWDRREDQSEDFSSGRTPYDQSRVDLVTGIGAIAVGLIIVLVLAVLPALR